MNSAAFLFGATMAESTNSQYLDVNAPIGPLEQSEQTPTRNSPEEEKELQQLLSSLQKWKGERKKVDTDWPKIDAYYDGDQWYGRKRPAYRASPVANVIRPAIQTILPIMTDTSPSIDTIPQDPSDYRFSEIMSKTIKSWWNRNSVSMTLLESIMDALKYGVGFLKLVWDADAENGLGDMKALAIDPRNVYVPDGAVDINNRCPGLIEMYPATVGELKRMFPDKTEHIRATGKRKETGDNPNNTETYVVSPVDKDDWTDNPNLYGSTNDNDVVWVAEMWVDDYAVEEIEMENKETGAIEKVQKRKYPNGKIVQAVPDLKLLLTVKPNPYDDGKKPYVRIVDTVRAREFWGDGEVKPYFMVQDLINQTLATIYDHQKAMINSVWIIDNESGVDPNMITNQCGLIINKNRGTEVRRDSPPSLPSEIYNFYEMMKSLFDTQSGVHDVTQGRKPTGITAAEAINSMQEAAQTRIRLKERNLQTALQQLGMLAISRILQYYTMPRVVRLTGDAGQPEYFEFYVQRGAKDNGKYQYKVLRYARTAGDNGEVEYVPLREWEIGKESKGVFDVEVVSGTSLPFMKSQRGIV